MIPLKKCDRCFHEVSPTAKECPYCGALVKGGSRLGCFGIIGALLILGLIGYFFGGNQSPKKTVNSTAKPTFDPTKIAVSNESFANYKDVRQAEKLLMDLPAECSNSSASASTEGVITIYIRCRKGSKIVDGEVSIKDGIVTKIR